MERITDSPVSGQVTVGSGAAVQLLSAITTTAQDLRLTRGVFVKAPKTNTGNIYVGTSSSVSTSNGYPLAAGDSVEVASRQLGNVWVIADAASQKAAFIGA